MAPRASNWWLVVSEGHVDVCNIDPGYDIAATVSTSLRTLTEIWRGDVSWSQALHDGSAVVSGSGDSRKALPDWIGQSKIAAVPRPA